MELHPLELTFGTADLGLTVEDTTRELRDLEVTELRAQLETYRQREHRADLQRNFDEPRACPINVATVDEMADLHEHQQHGEQQAIGRQMRPVRSIAVEGTGLHTGDEDAPHIQLAAHHVGEA